VIGTVSSSAARLLGALAVTGAVAGGVIGAVAAGRLATGDPGPAIAAASDVPVAMTPDARARRIAAEARASATAGLTPLPVKRARVPRKHRVVRHHARVKRVAATTPVRRPVVTASAARVAATPTVVAAAPVVRTPVYAPARTRTPAPKASTPVRRPDPARPGPKPDPSPRPTGSFDDSG
jgi:hypothetical protein